MSCSYEPGAATGNNAEIDKLALETDFSQLGRFLVTRKRGDIGAFKTPFLRDVLLTAPYIHDGSIETLWDVIEFFNKGGERNQFLDAEMKPLRLTESEVDDLANFLVLSRRTASRSYAPRSWIASAQLICTAGRPPGRIYSSAARASV